MAFDTDVVDDSSSNDEVAAVEVETESTDEAQTAPDADDSQDDAHDDGDEQSEVDTTDDEPKPDKKPSRASERIQQLVAEKRELEAKFEQLSQQSQQPQQRQSADGQPQKPNIDDFDLESQLDDYFEAQSNYEEQLSEWKLDQRLSQREQAKVTEQRQQQTMDDFKQAFEADPEFKENFAELQTWLADKPITADPSELYQGQDLMDVLAVIAGDGDLYYEIADMTETQQYARYGQIHAQLQSSKGKATIGRKVSKAPKPPNHTKANAPVKRDIYSQSDDDFLRSRGL